MMYNDYSQGKVFATMFAPEKNFRHWHLTGFAGAPAYLFETLDSTQSLMKARATAGEITTGTLMVADQQTAGRGRHERTWVSPAGKNLYFNILLPLDGIPLGSAPQLTQVAALTFAEIFRNLQDDGNAQGLGNRDIGKVTVKWPNDILCGKHKFCGILAELVYIKQPQGIAPKPALNLGVGINVNGDAADYIPLGRAVTTLKEITGQKVNREKLLQMLIGNLERALGQFRAFGISPWVEAWKKMDQFIGARGTIVVNNRCTDENRNSGEGSVKKTGSILNMNSDGSLLFKCDDGQIETVYSADLEI